MRRFVREGRNCRSHACRVLRIAADDDQMRDVPMVIDRYPRVHVLVVDSELDEYQRRAWRAKTAASA